MNPEVVLQFWFEELETKDWFAKNLDLDAKISAKFKDTHGAAKAGECEDWRQSIHGRLAEIILLDQFSRNMYRDTPEAFASDPLALVLSQEALRNGQVDSLKATERAFLTMPFMHSESQVIHEAAIKHFSHPDLSGYLNFEVRHKKIIDRFGRYPHRNEVLGRKFTAEEIQFLQEPGSSF